MRVLTEDNVTDTGDGSSLGLLMSTSTQSPGKFMCLLSDTDCTACSMLMPSSASCFIPYEHLPPAQSCLYGPLEVVQCCLGNIATTSALSMLLARLTWP